MNPGQMARCVPDDKVILLQKFYMMLNNLLLQCFGYSLFPAGSAKLGQDAADMELHRGSADEQLLGYLRVAQPFSHHLEHFLLPGGEHIVIWLLPSAGGPYQCLCRFGRECRLASVS